MKVRSMPIRALGTGLAAVLASGGMLAAAGGPAAAAPMPKVDLVFAIDTTGSMGSYISAVQASAKSITDLLFAKADARVALVDYKDLYADCPEDGYASRVDLDFTATGADFGPSVDSLTADGGCDTPESVYSGIMTGLALPWRPDASRSLLVMGDAAPQDPEPVTGYTLASVTAAANAGGVVVVPKAPAASKVPGTMSNAAEAKSFAAAAAAPPVALYTVNIDAGDGGGGPAFAGLAKATGGETYPATDPSSAVEQITEAITKITSGPALTQVRVKYTGQRSGLSGQRARLQAYVTGPKNTKLVDVPVVFTLGSATCTARTKPGGQAACAVVTPEAHGTLPVTAKADAGAGFLPGETSELYTIKEPKRRSPVPTPTPAPPTPTPSPSHT